MRRLADRLVTSVLLIAILTSFWTGTVRTSARQQAPVAASVCQAFPIVASPVASPVAATPQAVTTSSSATVAVAAAIANLVACWDAGDWTTAASLVTDAFRGVDPTAYADRQVRLSEAGLTARSQLTSVETVRDLAPGLVSADLQWQEGSARKRERWTMANAGGRWLLEAIAPLPLDIVGDAVGIEATVDGQTLTPSRSRVVNPGIVVIHVQNAHIASITVALIRVPTIENLRARFQSTTGAATASILAGQILVEPGEARDLVLADLRADNYTLLAAPTLPSTSEDVANALSTGLEIAAP